MWHKDSAASQIFTLRSDDTRPTTRSHSPGDRCSNLQRGKGDRRVGDLPVAVFARGLRRETRPGAGGGECPTVPVTESEEMGRVGCKGFSSKF